MAHPKMSEADIMAIDEKKRIQQERRLMAHFKMKQGLIGSHSKKHSEKLGYMGIIDIEGAGRWNTGGCRRHHVPSKCRREWFKLVRFRSLLLSALPQS